MKIHKTITIYNYVALNKLNIHIFGNLVYSVMVFGLIFVLQKKKKLHYVKRKRV